MRVGGSSWRPQIDPKRPQAMKHSYCHAFCFSLFCFFCLREPQDIVKITFGSKTFFFSVEKPSCRLGGSLVFKGRRVILETQNRPEEAPSDETQLLPRFLLLCFCLLFFFLLRAPRHSQDHLRIEHVEAPSDETQLLPRFLLLSFSF